VEKPDGKRPVGRRRWEDNIKVNVREVGWDGVDWIDQAHDSIHWLALVNTVMKLWVL
jgi:hypothetical protein